ncbi:MAG: DNA-binding protein [Elainellaceae cyanobacterium]
MDAIALRLKPQQDLKVELNAFICQQEIEAACILTCVGSLTRAALRLAGQSETTMYEGKFEIVSLTGVMSRHGAHYHVAIADHNGCTYGGHLLEGCLIYTTAEIVIGVLPDLRFKREYDLDTGYHELFISSD